MTYNNLSALSTAIIYAQTAKCNDNQAAALEAKVLKKFLTAPVNRFLATNGVYETQIVTVDFNGGANSVVIEKACLIDNNEKTSTERAYEIKAIF